MILVEKGGETNNEISYKYFPEGKRRAKPGVITVMKGTSRVVSFQPSKYDELLEDDGKQDKGEEYKYKYSGMVMQYIKYKVYSSDDAIIHKHHKVCSQSKTSSTSKTNSTSKTSSKSKTSKASKA